MTLCVYLIVHAQTTLIADPNHTSQVHPEGGGGVISDPESFPFCTALETFI